MSNKWRFRLAYVVMSIAAATLIYALLRDAQKRDATTTTASWWRGLSKAEIAVQLESGRAPVPPDGAGALVPICWPKGPRLCVVRAVTNNRLVLIYFQVVADVWTIQHVESLNSGAGTAVPNG